MSLMQVWAEPVPDAPEPQGCAATLEKEATEDKPEAPISPSAQSANAISLAALSLEKMQTVSAAPQQLPQASAEHLQDASAAPSQHGDVRQQSHAALSPSESGRGAADGKGQLAPHPLLSITPGSSVGSEAAICDPSLHPLLQVPLLHLQCTTSQSRSFNVPESELERFIPPWHAQTKGCRQCT